jgi:hypothetical protein
MMDADESVGRKLLGLVDRVRRKMKAKHERSGQSAPQD